MGQGQLRVIIYINFVEFEYIMPHAKFYEHRTIKSVGEDFLRFLPYVGMVIIWSCDLKHLYKISFHLPKEAPHEIWL